MQSALPALITSAASLVLGACGQPGSSSELPSKEAQTAQAPPATTAAPLASATADGPSPTEAPTATAVAQTAAPTASAGADSPTKQAPSAAAVASAAATALPTTSATASATAVASAAAAPALTVQSSALQESGFSVWMQTAKTYKVGQSATVEVVLVPKGEFHCNDKYPYKVKLGTPPPGVSYPQDIARDASVSATRTSVRVPFTATSAGDARISGKFSFSVCKADQCVIDSREVAATVKVE